MTQRESNERAGVVGHYATTQDGMTALITATGNGTARLLERGDDYVGGAIVYWNPLSGLNIHNPAPMQEV